MEKLLIVFDFSYICKRRNAEDFLRSNLFSVWSGGSKTGQNSPYFIREYPVGSNKKAKTPTKSDAWTIKQQLSFFRSVPRSPKHSCFHWIMQISISLLLPFLGVCCSMLMHIKWWSRGGIFNYFQTLSSPPLNPDFPSLILILIFYQTTLFGPLLW